MMVNIDSFVKKNVIKRSESMFLRDIELHREELQEGIKGKSVLVIGGAGTIGSFFIKALLPFAPKELVVVDYNENGLTELTRDIRSTEDLPVPKGYITYPIDYSSTVFEKLFRKHYGFDIVANFSAHKHVRSEKDIYSVEAMLRNNILSAKKLLDLLVEFPPDVYFCVSTDKAANPVNIMGASKRIMEDLIFGYSEHFTVKTARFANVAFSNGSLLDGFLRRIEKRQPVSAPLDVKRYFVSMEEAGQICMLSAILGNNREIFFPRLSTEQMMTFDAIASSLLEENGYEVLNCASEEEAIAQSEKLKQGGRKYPVYFSLSDTSGEKQFEEFYTDGECVDLQRFSSLGVIIGKRVPEKDIVDKLYTDLKNALDDPDITKEVIISLLEGFLPNFKHIETGKMLDSKM